mmetsp:Transcript_12508/g.31490  ORF Transcript_12508/g.31490 Transcript_12508/m.31490 type:complete len:328 (-) Transcript_12508:734-1717(-)
MIPSRTFGTVKTSQPLKLFPHRSRCLSFAPPSKQLLSLCRLHSLCALPSQKPLTGVHPCISHPLPGTIISVASVSVVLASAVFLSSSCLRSIRLSEDDERTCELSFSSGNNCPCFTTLDEGNISAAFRKPSSDASRSHRRVGGGRSVELTTPSTLVRLPASMESSSSIQLWSISGAGLVVAMAMAWTSTSPSGIACLRGNTSKLLYILLIGKSGLYPFGASLMMFIKSYSSCARGNHIPNPCICTRQIRGNQPYIFSHVFRGLPSSPGSLVELRYVRRFSRMILYSSSTCQCDAASGHPPVAIPSSQRSNATVKACNITKASFRPFH